MQKWLLIAAVIFGGLGVAAGSFGAHALKRKLDPDLLNAFEVGVRYQMYHALAIGLVVFVSTLVASQMVWASGWVFVAGTIVFSGSLYLLALTGVRWIGAITPIGGALLLAGWVLLAVAIFKNSSTSP